MKGWLRLPTEGGDTFLGFIDGKPAICLMTMETWRDCEPWGNNIAIWHYVNEDWRLLVTRLQEWAAPVGTPMTNYLFNKWKALTPEELLTLSERMTSHHEFDIGEGPQEPQA